MNMATAAGQAKRKVHKQRKARPAKKRLALRRSRKIGQMAPRTAKQYFAMPREFQDVWDRAVRVPGMMRTQGMTLTRASKQLGVNRETVLQLTKSAFGKKRNGRYVAKSYDRLLRILVIPTKTGLQEIAVSDSRQASLVGEFWNGLNHYLGPNADPSGLAKFRKRLIKTAAGKRIRLLTDLNEIRRQASFGNLRFEELYGRTA